jgi:hypothetical protein
MFREVPSLSRLLDTHLKVEVVPGPVTNTDNLFNVTVSIPTEDFGLLTGDEIENLYFRPMVRAIAEKINALGNVKASEIPLPEKEIAFNCNNGKIPVLLRVVRRTNPDRHQILIHVLVQPENENEAGVSSTSKNL